MPCSLAHRDYRLMMAVESASRANSWYRVLIDHQSGQLSCDCPAYIQEVSGQSHLAFFEALIGGLIGGKIQNNVCSFKMPS